MEDTVHAICQARILEWVAFPFSRGSSNPGIEPRSPTLQADSWPAEPQGKHLMGNGLKITVNVTGCLKTNAGGLRLVLWWRGLLRVQWGNLWSFGILNSWMWMISCVCGHQLNPFNPQILRFDYDKIRVTGHGQKLHPSLLGLSWGKTHVDHKNQRVAK